MNKDFDSVVEDFVNTAAEKIDLISRVKSLESKEMKKTTLDSLEMLSQCPLSCDFWLPRNCRDTIQKLIKYIRFLEKK